MDLVPVQEELQYLINWSLDLHFQTYPVKKYSKIVSFGKGKGEPWGPMPGEKAASRGGIPIPKREASLIWQMLTKWKAPASDGQEGR